VSEFARSQVKLENVHFSSPAGRRHVKRQNLAGNLNATIACGFRNRAFPRPPSFRSIGIVSISTIYGKHGTIMAYLVKRPGDRIEIRESRSTSRGPRSRQLARFVGALTPAVLARAATSASRPFDADALIRRARVMGIPVETKAPEKEARTLLARLRRADTIDPVMAGLLVRALEDVVVAPIPEPLAEVSEWIGSTPAERGAALWDLLEMFGRIEASRPSRRTRTRKTFPRFSSAETAAAS